MDKKIEFEAKPDFVEHVNGRYLRFGPVIWLKGDIEYEQKYHVTLEPVPSALLLCPFCGGEPHPASSITTTWCRNCGAEVNRRTVDETSMEMWNRRDGCA
jgi:hypothetical protein